MMKLTFRHTRDIFSRGDFLPWIRRVFGEDILFDGCEYENNYPTILTSYQTFEIKKGAIPTKNLIKIEGSFTVLEQFSLGVRCFSNDLRATQTKK